MKIGTDWWEKSVRKVYAEENKSDPEEAGSQMTRLTGLGDYDPGYEEYGILVQHTEFTDIRNNKTVTKVFTYRETATETRITEYPDPDPEKSIAKTVSINGRLKSSVSRTGTETSYEYDDLGRRTHVTDSRTNVPAVTDYKDNGQVDYITDPSEKKTVYFTFDDETGRKTKERVLTESGEEYVTRYSYSERGQITNIWGNADYPVQYGYDDLGRLQYMCTYRDGIGWDGSEWPENASCTDRTEWIYDPDTGLLKAKKDAENKSVSYDYTPGGKLETRTWARENGSIVTTYNYDPKTAELLNIDYSDTTPDIGFTYDRLGRQKTVKDAVGTRTFEYDPDKLELNYVSITQDASFSASGMYNRTVTRKYDTYGRSAGFFMGTDY
ncbi:MAG: RHS repeat protein, partial [Gammaproteobacteria bacterium]|nr:RHS repeat protein [Gammaproteobacteria bacterium]